MRAPPRGLTLVEVMVALVLFTSGVLALARAADLSSRALFLARRREAVATVARATLDSLRWRSCGGAVDGTAIIAIGGTRAGLQTWHVAPGGAGLRSLTDSVTVDAAAGATPVRFALEAAVACP